MLKTQTQSKSAKTHNTQKHLQKQYLKQSKTKKLFFSKKHLINV
jgi:hypothetical protein